MVDKEDNFNEYLNQKVEESSFEFNDAYWQKAEQLIAQLPSKRKPLFWFLGWGAASVFLLSTFFMIGYYTGKPSTTANSKHQELNNVPTVQQASSASNLNADIPSETIETAVAAKNLAPSNTANSRIPESNLTPLNAVKKQVKLQTVTTKNLNGNTQTQQLQHNVVNASIIQQPKQEQPILIADVSETTAKTADEQLISDVIIEPEELKNEEENTANEAGNKDIDVNALSNCEANKEHKWMFDLVGGISDSRGFEGNTTTTDKLGFGYFGGIRAAYKVDKNWFVAMQPILYSRGAINTKIESQKVDYDFGATQDQFVVKNKSLLFAELPILVGYRVGRHQVSAGAGFEYLLNAKSDVKDFGSETYKVNQWGYIDGFNRMGTMAIFNYSFRVYNNWCLNLMVQKGFTDFTKENYFTTNSSDKNMNLRIGFKYLINNQKKKAK